jgi:hypothetical protein
MRVLIGLIALAATANAQVQGPAKVTPDLTNFGNLATQTPVGLSPCAEIIVKIKDASGLDISNTKGQNNVAGYLDPTISSSPRSPAGSQYLATSNWAIYVENVVNQIYFNLKTNIYTGQMQYRWAPNMPIGNAQPGSYFCDPCSDPAHSATPSLTACNTATGPGAPPSPTVGYSCASLNREYIFSNLVASGNTQFVNSVSFQLFDTVTNPAPNTSSYSFQIVRKSGIIVGDPQIVGMQGQDFQVHGMPDEIFNMITYPTVQVNARFTYLESGACHDNFTACFAHPGTYISEEGFRIGKDKVRVTAGSFKKGLTVHVNGKKISSNVDLKNGAVQLVSHRRVVVHTEIMKVSISNSDHFLNQELDLQDDKLIYLGQTRKVLKDNERFHPEVPLHGLQGQTWRNVEYSSGLEYEGSIMDYHVVDGNLFGTDFVFNQFKA